MGNLTKVIDANGNPLSYEYNELNRQIRSTNALGNPIAFLHDGVGNLIQKTKADGAVITHSYDSRNRLVRTDFPNNTFKFFEYDNAGRVVRFGNEHTTETRVYDANGRLWIAQDQHNGQIDYSYDEIGNRVAIMDSAKGVMSYEYDAKNRVVAFTDPEGGVTGYEYDSMGRVVRTTHPNNTQTIEEYNADNRLTSIATYGEREGTLSSFAYTYDSVGNKLSMTEEDGDMTTYEYDKLYRLTFVDYPQREWEPELTDEEKNNGTLNGKDNKKGHFKNICDETTDCLPSAVRYAYDPAGNRISHTDDWQTVEYQYNSANQMLQAGTAQFSYDENGNRIQKSDSGDVANYFYNYDDMMEQVDSPNGESTGYGYDALGRRIYKVDQDGNSTNYLYDGINVLQEISGQLNQKIATYYRVNGRILTRQEFSVSQGENDAYQNRPTGRQLYYSYDGLGSVASLSNHDGNLQTRYQYDAFGEMTGGDITENPYTFTGKRFDEESGMYHFHFRQYDPGTGVWTTPDPIGVLGGVNLYSYVFNNPVNFIDPYGLEMGPEDEGYDSTDQFGDGPGSEDEETAGARGDGIDGGDDESSSGDAYFNHQPNKDRIRDDLFGPITGFEVPDYLATPSPDTSNLGSGWVEEMFRAAEEQFLFAASIAGYYGVVNVAVALGIAGYTVMGINNLFFREDPLKDTIYHGVGVLISPAHPIGSFMTMEAIDIFNDLTIEMEEIANGKDKCGTGSNGDQ